MKRASLRQRPCQLDDLTLLERKPVSRLTRVNRHSPFIEDLGSAPHHLSPPDAHRPEWPDLIDEQILGHTHRRDQRAVLKQASDLRLPRCRASPCRDSTEEHLACIGFEEAGESSDDCRLTGTVPPEKGVRFARLNGDRNVAERICRAESLAHVDQGGRSVERNPRQPLSTAP